MDLKLKKQFREETNLDVFVWDENNNVAFTEAYVNWLEKQCNIADVSQRSELLPDFLYEDDGIIKVGVHGDSTVTDEWNDYLKKLGNCG